MNRKSVVLTVEVDLGHGNPFDPDLTSYFGIPGQATDRLCTRPDCA